MRIYNNGSGSLVIANDLGQIISVFGAGEINLQPIGNYVTLSDLNLQRVIVRELFSNIFDINGVAYGANIQATCVELSKIINAINGVVGGVVVNYEFFTDLPPIGELERLYYVYGDVPQALYAWDGATYVNIGGGGVLPLLPIFLDETSTIADFASGNTYYYIGEAPITYDYDLEPYPLPVPISGFNFVNLSVFDVAFNSDGGNTNYLLKPSQSLEDIQVIDNGGFWQVLYSQYFDNLYDLQQVTGKGAITTNAIIVRNNPDNYRTRYSIVGQQVQRSDLGYELNYLDNGITKIQTGSKSWALQIPDLATNANSSSFLVQFRPNVSGTVAYLSDISSGSSSWLDPVIAIQNTPPITPTTGDRYIVGTAPTGAWVGNANNIAEWDGTIWVYTTPINGNVVVVTSIAPPNNIYQFNGTTWVVSVSNPFLQGGNNFGANGILGLTSSNDLDVITNNISRLKITSAGRFAAGTTIGTPLSVFHLFVPNAAVGGLNGFRISNPAGVIAMFEIGTANDSYVGTLSSSNFSIRTNNVQRVLFDTTRMLMSVPIDMQTLDLRLNGANFRINVDNSGIFRYFASNVERIFIAPTGNITLNNNTNLQQNGGLITISDIASNEPRLRFTNNFRNWDILEIGSTGFGIRNTTLANSYSYLVSSTNRTVINGNAIVNSAILAINGVDGGFLMPQLTLAQRNAIATPATHLLVSQTDGFAGQYTRKASSWALLQDSEYSHVRIKTITATETPALTDNVILVNAAGGAITVNLPSAASAYDSNLLVGKTYVIKKIDASANVVTIDGNGAETIDGTATILLNTQNERIRIVSNGSNWFIL